MSEKKARETFEVWLNSSPVNWPAYLDCWLAAWNARGAADIDALGMAVVNLTAGYSYFKLIKKAIRALDSEGSESR